MLKVLTNKIWTDWRKLNMCKRIRSLMDFKSICYKRSNYLSGYSDCCTKVFVSNQYIQFKRFYGRKNANLINSEMKIITRFMNFLFVGLIFLLHWYNRKNLSDRRSRNFYSILIILKAVMDKLNEWRNVLYDNFITKVQKII